MKESDESSNRMGQSSAPRWLAFFLLLVVLLLSDQTVYRFLHTPRFSYANAQTATFREGGIGGALARTAVRVIESFETWGESVYVLVVALSIWKLDSSRRSRVLCMFVAALLVSFSVEVTKRAVGRERPDVSQGAFAFRGPTRESLRSEYQSFPSGHTAAAASFSGSVAAFYPPMRTVSLLLVLGTASSRIWKERHYPSDCWAAAAFGFWFSATLPRRRWMQPFLAWFDRRYSIDSNESVKRETRKERSLKRTNSQLDGDSQTGRFEPRFFRREFPVSIEVTVKNPRAKTAEF